jgi:hypothetical protein
MPEVVLLEVVVLEVVVLEVVVPERERRAGRARRRTGGH